MALSIWREKETASENQVALEYYLTMYPGQLQKNLKLDGQPLPYTAGVNKSGENFQKDIVTRFKRITLLFGWNKNLHHWAKTQIITEEYTSMQQFQLQILVALCLKPAGQFV